MSNDRLYTEKEISKILKKEGEIQVSEREKVTVGLSLEELQQLAEEVGLEPDIIANVAQEIDIEPEPEPGFFGSLLMPTKIDIDQVIPGTITENEWPEIVSMIERSTGKSGSSSQIGKMLEWTADSRHSVHKLSVIPSENQTKIIFQGTFTQLALAWTLPILINVAVWAFIIAMINLGLIGIPIGLAVSFVTYLAILSGFRSFIKKKKQSIRSVFSKMSGLFRTESSTKEKAGSQANSGRIEIPSQDEMESNSSSESVRGKVKD
jgi:hypothetical protein